MLRKRKKQPEQEKMTPKEYQQFLEGNDMEPSDDTIEAAMDGEEDEMSEEDYDNFLIENEMKPLGYIEEGE